MTKEHEYFVTSEKAQKAFGFQRTRVFKSFDITYVVAMLGKQEEYHMLFALCSRWDLPVVQFFDTKFSDQDKMPYGSLWCDRELFEQPGFVTVGDTFYTMDEYGLFCCVNYLADAIQRESIFMLPVAGSTPILRKTKDIN